MSFSKSEYFRARIARGQYILQNYLDEFAYKLNSRYFKSVFERLVIASLLILVQTSDETYSFISNISNP